MRKLLLIVSATCYLQFANIASANEIPTAYINIAKKHQINVFALFSLAKTESGKNIRLNDGNKVFMPWPYTANICNKAPGVACKGYWFKSREELYARLSNELKRGNDWFDLGAVQMNWHYHKNRFNQNLWVATHPLVNINQASILIKELNTKFNGNINDVFGAYHAGSGFKTKRYSSKRKAQINAYINKTVTHYNEIIRKHKNQAIINMKKRT